MFYFVKTPFWIKKLFKRQYWTMPNTRKVIYLSFDDGPNDAVTKFVLDELDKYNAKATFFCIGKNVVNNPELYQRILENGHAVGNHTYDHLNGWKTKDDLYINNVNKARQYINSNLFRPPYGRVTRSQVTVLTGPENQLHTIMWDVLSGDFDETISNEKCCKNVIKNTKPGSIIVFHDSEKAYAKMSYCLPLVLQYFSAKGFVFEQIILG